jgi:hypothetical protein
MSESANGAPVQRKSLAGSFGSGTQDRAEGLRGLLPTRSTRPRPPQVEPSPVSPTPTPQPTREVARPPAQPIATVVKQPSPSPAAKRARAVAAPAPIVTDDEELDLISTGTTVSVTAYLDQSTRTALLTRASEGECEHSDVVVAAFDAVGSGLADLFKPTVGRSASGMPIRREVPQVKGGIETWFRFTTDQRDWLDEQRKSVGAKSRSHLLARLLAHYLQTN